MTALQLVINERLRQQTEEGYTPEHDDKHTEGQLALLAAAYALGSISKVRCREFYLVTEVLEKTYGWKVKPKDPISDLVRAGALILAELERRLSAEEK